MGLRKNLQAMAVMGAGAMGVLAAAVPAPASAEWTIPEEERQVPNPVERTAESIEIGHKLFRENCETCHGPAGLGDGPGARVLEARLPNLQDAEWASTKTDGEWFYKIAVGKDPMVGYEDFLEEEEIWHVVNYARSLSVAQADAGATSEAPSEEAANPPAEEAEAAEEAAPADEETPAVEAAEEAEAHEEAEAADAEHGEEAHGEEHGEEAHGEEHAEDHGDEDHAAAAAHGDHDDHGDAGHSAPPADFNPKAIANYEAGYGKGPLVWALVLPILIGGVFVLFQKMVPPPPVEEAPAHGDDHGH